MDFVFANKLHLINSVATGEFTVADYFIKGEEYARSNVFPYIAQQYHINTQNIIYVGDGKRDSRLLSEAGIGVAFCPQYPGNVVEKVADKIISGLSLAPLLDIAQASPAKFGIKLPAISKKQARTIGVSSLIGLAGAGLIYFAVRQIRNKKAAVAAC